MFYAILTISIIILIRLDNLIQQFPILMQYAYVKVHAFSRIGTLFTMLSTSLGLYLLTTHTYKYTHIHSAIQVNRRLLIQLHLLHIQILYVKGMYSIPLLNGSVRSFTSGHISTLRAEGSGTPPNCSTVVWWRPFCSDAHS